MRLVMAYLQLQEQIMYQLFVPQRDHNMHVMIVHGIYQMMVKIHSFHAMVMDVSNLAMYTLIHP